MERHILVDDLDGSIEGVERHTIAIDGVLKEIDLTKENLAILHEAMSRFVAVSRPCGGTKAATNGHKVVTKVLEGKKPAHNDPEQLKKVREWAWARGMEVSKYGRIPEPVLEAYQKLAGRTHGGELTPSGGRSIFSDAVH